MTRLKRTRHQAITSLLTPFTEDKLDLASLAVAIDRQVDAQMDGVVVCDAVGEGFSLCQGERDQILHSCVARAKQHLTIIAAAGTNCTGTSIEQCRQAERLGADALLVTIPYYSKPTLRGVVDHFRQIANAIRLPIIIDDDPGRTAIDHGLGLLHELADLANIHGISHGPDRLGHFTRLPAEIKTRYLHLSRDDRTLAEFLVIGGGGANSAIGNVVPAHVKAVVDTADAVGATGPSRSNFLAAVAALGRDDIAAVKEAASFIHQVSAEVRLPLVAAEPETVVRIRHAFAPFVRCEEDDQAA